MHGSAAVRHQHCELLLGHCITVAVQHRMTKRICHLFPVSRKALLIIQRPDGSVAKHQLCVHIHGPVSGVPRPCSNVDTVSSNMTQRIFTQPHRAVNACTGVPAGARRFMDDPHNNAVIAFLQIRRNVKLKGGIPIFPLPCLLSVYIECRIHVYAFKPQRAAALRRYCIQS
ncbi:hypothetical protein D3C75_272020 [compost metagenome]